jgi:hypothetical protein
MTQLPVCAMAPEFETHRKIRTGGMPAHKMKFVVVNNGTPRNVSVCAACARPLERGYLHDLPYRDAIAGSSATPGEWIRRIGCHSEPVRPGHRLAKADS